MSQAAQQTVAPAVRAPQSVGELLASKRQQLEMALPKHLSVDRLLRICMTEVMKNPRLKECTATSLVGAVLQTAQLGLEPGGHLGHAYLVPYRNKKRGCTEAQFQVGYKGMLALARRSGEVSTVVARAVYENDTFEYEYGLNERLVHVASRDERGKFIAVYAIVQFKDGSKQFEVLLKAEVDEYRKCSQSADDGPWVTDYDAMAKKTAIRQLCKYMPMSPEMQQATTLDELADKGISQENSLLVDSALAVAEGQDVPMEVGAPVKIQASVPKSTSAKSKDLSQERQSTAAEPAVKEGGGGTFASFAGGPIQAKPKKSREELIGEILGVAQKLGMDIKALDAECTKQMKKAAQDLTLDELVAFHGHLNEAYAEQMAGVK